MCGISGWIVSRDYPLRTENLDRMIVTLDHRGPDSSGSYHNREYDFALGHNRLSIIDLSEKGNQPMINPDNGDVLSFNGEIYNFGDIKKELINHGYKFRSQSDTEVLLYSFAEWGIECLNKIKGMYAFALWSEKDKTLHLARDPMGIKPLYYWPIPSKSGLVFSSEVKGFIGLPGFQQRINRSSLDQFLEFGYVFDNQETMYEGVFKLPPGHRLQVARSGEVNLRRFYEPDLRELPVEGRQDLEKDLHSALTEVVNEHLVADVPVGLLLSGGLDSSILAALGRRSGPLHTFSMGFHQSGVDERKFGRIVSEYIGSEHDEILIHPSEVMEDLDGSARHYDDLFGDWGMISTRLLYGKCRQAGIKVVIVGEGSDELFGGYSVFRFAVGSKGWDSREWRMFQLYRSYAGRRYGSQYWNFRRVFLDYLNQVEGDWFSAVRLFESRNQLPNNYVMKVDKASMSVSVEARTPYLDSRISDIAYRIPADLLISEAGEKDILRRISRRYNLLPEEIISRKKFGAGIASNWMDDSREFREYSRASILGAESWADELGLRAAMKSYFDDGESGYRFPRAISIFRNLAWRLLLLNLWSRAYGVSPGSA